MISGQISQPFLTEYAILRLWISVLKKVSHSDCVGVQISTSQVCLVLSESQDNPKFNISKRHKEQTVPSSKSKSWNFECLAPSVELCYTSLFSLILCGSKLTYLYVE